MKRRKTAHLLLDESPLLVFPTLAKKIGLTEAVIVQQIHFLTTETRGNERDGYKWVYNNAQQWSQIFRWLNAGKLKYYLRKLKARKLIISTTKYNQSAWDKTPWYRVDKDAVSAVR